MKSIVALRNSSSIVSMRLMVSAAVSSQLCLPHLPKRGSSPGVSVRVATHLKTPRGPKRSLNSMKLRAFGRATAEAGLHPRNIAFFVFSKPDIAIAISNGSFGRFEFRKLLIRNEARSSYRGVTNLERVSAIPPVFDGGDPSFHLFGRRIAHRGSHDAETPAPVLLI